MKRQSEGYGPKIATTAIIWGLATAMLAICIPLVTSTGSGVILPLAVILGASGGTVVVWRTKNHRNGEIFELMNNVSELRQRVVDLETICSSDDFEIQKKLKQL